MVPKCPKCGSTVSVVTDISYVPYDKGYATGYCENPECKTKIRIEYVITISRYEAE